jgi:hypothetical protein
MAPSSPNQTARQMAKSSESASAPGESSRPAAHKPGPPGHGEHDRHGQDNEGIRAESGNDRVEEDGADSHRNGRDADALEARSSRVRHRGIFPSRRALDAQVRGTVLQIQLAPPAGSPGPSSLTENALRRL